MANILRIDSSIYPTSSVSRALSQLFTETWSTRPGERTVVERDLRADPPPHLSNPGLHYAPRLRAGDEEHPESASELQHRYIDEIAAADLVVVGAPMYNWSIPSTLKAWIDHIHVLGVTAPFDTPDQPFAGKPVVVISSRGLSYGAGAPDEGKDHTLPPIELVLGGALGMSVTTVVADLTLARRLPPLHTLADQADASLAAAQTQVKQLATALGV